MGFGTYYTILGGVSAILLVGVIVDQAYQRLSHKWTNEPPLLPYRIPIIGHALMYSSSTSKLFKTAQKHFPNCQPYSLMLFGKRVYVFTHNKDVTMVYRKVKALPFLPLIEKLAWLAWDISPDGLRRLTEVDETGDSLFRNAHDFYRDALKIGPQLDLLTVNFLRYLQKEFDEFEAQQASGDVHMRTWSKLALSNASTNAMMGPALLRDNPDLLASTSLVDCGFFLYVNKVPRLFAKKYYQARDHVLTALTNYFSDERNREGSAALIWDREIQLRAKGMTTRDVAAYSYSAYAAYVIPVNYLKKFITNTMSSLLNNTNPIAYWLLYRIFTHNNSLARLRAEVAPAFAGGNSITTVEQVNYLLTSCPLLRAFYDETLRLHTTSSSNRIVVEDTSIGGYTLRVGHNIICPAFAQHHVPEYFGEDTEKFDPERFLKPVLAKGAPADPKMVRAFGGGVSLCSGRFFASNEVLSYAASVLWRYDIEFKRNGMASIVPRKRGQEVMSGNFPF